MAFRWHALGLVGALWLAGCVASEVPSSDEGDLVTGLDVMGPVDAGGDPGRDLRISVTGRDDHDHKHAFAANLTFELQEYHFSGSASTWTTVKTLEARPVVPSDFEDGVYLHKLSRDSSIKTNCEYRVLVLATMESTGRTFREATNCY